MCVCVPVFVFVYVHALVFVCLSAVATLVYSRSLLITILIVCREHTGSSCHEAWARQSQTLLVAPPVGDGSRAHKEILMTIRAADGKNKRKMASGLTRCLSNPDDIVFAFEGKCIRCERFT